MRKNHFSRVFVAVSAVLALFIGQTAQADIIITEVAYNRTNTDATREYVEIYNNGNSSVDISGWDIIDDDDPDGSLPVPNGTSMAPGEVLVLILDDDLVQFDAEWGAGINAVPIGDGDPRLSNGGDPLDLRDGSGAIIDSVHYDDAAPWPVDVEGVSIYLKSGFLNATDNDNGANWANSENGVLNAFQSTNNDGADGHFDTGSPGVLSVPEPTSLALLSIVGLSGLIRRRK